MSDRVDEIERAICEEHWPASKVFTQMKQVIQSLEADLEVAESRAKAWEKSARRLSGLHSEAMEENTELRREVANLADLTTDLACSLLEGNLHRQFRSVRDKGE